MAALTFPEARSTVIRQLTAALTPPQVETVALGASQGRILAEDIAADRDYPPFDRSVRDGFAVRAQDLPGTVRVIGEVRAGEVFGGSVSHGEAVEIMTGAPMPAGVDAVVMVEHCVRNGDGTVSTTNHSAPGSNVAPRGCEAKEQAAILARGYRIDYTGVSWLAATGHAQVHVFARPRVAIIATGDEIVEIGEQPAAHQIRNSNAWSLAAQVERAGGIPVVLPIARDVQSETRRLIEQGLEADLLLLSGGVSAGKYDVVELALADLGAEFFFDRVLIQPGQPLVFGRARGKFFFGLPGNPGSTMVTFELFARAAIELTGGAGEAPLPLTLARLTRPFRHKTGLTRFLPARLSCAEVTPVEWRGSGDIPALCRANAFLVADAGQAEYKEGETIPVLPK
ncbi:MAG: gephyrin-like molybdotransferase Glp [Bryobacteraceae bacterium]